MQHKDHSFNIFPYTAIFSEQFTFDISCSSVLNQIPRVLKLPSSYFMPKLLSRILIVFILRPEHKVSIIIYIALNILSVLQLISIVYIICNLYNHE